MRNLISVSSAPIAKLGGKKYYDLSGTLEVLRMVFRDSAVDGFELQLEPEWDGENPPLTDAELADWAETPKFTFREILTLLREQRLPVLSIHASRDVGNYLCSGRKRDLEKGKRLISDSLSLADDLETEICVFHIWDTWKTKFDPNKLTKGFLDIASQFPRVKASVENIPTHLKHYTPFSLVEQFDFVTLDLRWAALYDELDKFESVIDKVVNVHLRGRLEQNTWVLDRSSFSFQEALDRITNRWRYQGLLTVEPEGGVESPCYDSFIRAMKSLKN
ncbi:MAG: hypothetical protein ABSF24_01150 [Candidatus Bathyarchaeia archaeon]